MGCNQGYPGHSERFDYHRQVLCREGLTGRCYWEVEWEGEVEIGVTYRGIARRGRGEEGELGQNIHSWCLHFDDSGYCFGDAAWYDGDKTELQHPLDNFDRVGVYLHQSAGILSFYSVSSGKLTHIHTFHSTFTEELYPGFLLCDSDSTVTLCQL